MLYLNEAHEPLLDTLWDAGAVRGAMEAILADLGATYDHGAFWPVHPEDAGNEADNRRYRGLYLGAAGVLGALAYLEREGAAESGLDLAAAIAEVEAAAPVETEVPVPGYLLGEAGVLLVSWRLAPSPAKADRLAALVADNAQNPARELLWGAPGTMLAARLMHAWTGEDRWAQLWAESAEQLLSTLHQPSGLDATLWRQDLYGREVCYLGAAHGFAGNMHALFSMPGGLTPVRSTELIRLSAETLANTAHCEAGLANWPARAESAGRMSVQWCHGAPGMVTAFANVPVAASETLDRLLLDAGELTWRAGPLVKGHGLCHGTAGNGYAFLKLFRRTGDEFWLMRARAFAMHAIDQQRRWRERFGRGWPTYWTGDAGLAVYLWHCLAGEADMLTLDML